MTDRRPTDNAAFGPLKGGSQEPTYGGVLSFMRRRYCRDLAGVDLVVWGVPFDAATSNRPGARFGPQAIRRASAILDGDPQYPFGIDLFERLTVVDWGDCSLDYGRPAEATAEIAAQAGAIVASGAQLLTLGGDHSVTLGLLCAHAAQHGPLALVQFDAHQDTWHAEDGGRIDHGSVTARAIAEGYVDPARSIQIGVRTVAPDGCGLDVVDAYTVADLGVRGVVERIRRRVGEGPAYLSFDIDALDPAFAPGTGTPVAGGLSSREALTILRGLEPIDWRGMDVVEVAPPYDHADITAIAASAIAMHYVGLIARKRGS
ncbi:agmatinase [Blastochloris viridis]|uniref:Agmatinase n=1 Tax=Blastochloris viridis TaxID=1079 RepID=A0A0H5BHE8_BLAVI|nr:agmatinase [Blastochloris viridis]ALK09542.1 Agmatinase [Blastochloris viridis]BAS00570.1 agmatinase [Blastochloris viridis]CUU42205.1 Agmatinase [Blastochloris viridis]